MTIVVGIAQNEVEKVGNEVIVPGTVAEDAQKGSVVVVGSSVLELCKLLLLSVAVLEMCTLEFVLCVLLVSVLILRIGCTSCGIIMTRSC